MWHSSNILERHYLIREVIKNRLNWSIAYCHSGQKLLSSRLLSKNTNIKIYRSTVLPVVLCGWETWSLTLREGHRLRVIKNGVPRRIFWTKRDDIIGGSRSLHNEALNNLFFSSDIIRTIKSRRMRLAGHVVRMRGNVGVYRFLVETGKEGD
jgi:hypothetical protein